MSANSYNMLSMNIKRQNNGWGRVKVSGLGSLSCCLIELLLL